MFPANAGMIPGPREPQALAIGVPRECGDDPGIAFGYINGNLVFPANAGMIPASALAGTG